MNNNLEKYLEEGKSRKHIKNPSFSSVLLDEVFRSIDGDIQILNSSARKSINNVKCKSFWDNHYDSFTSTSRSSSSDSCFSSGHSFSSEAEYSSVPYNKSSKPIRGATNDIVPPRPHRRQDSFHLRTQDSYHKKCNNISQSSNKNTDNLMIKSKSRAMKIYSNLKKIKQPISPGGRLSSFIFSLFSSDNSKKMKNKNDGVNKNEFFGDGNFERNMKSINATSSFLSASSFSRSCLSQNTGTKKAKTDNIERTSVRFYHVSNNVHVNEHKFNTGLRGCQNRKKRDEFVMEMRNVDNYDEEDDDNEDGFSECSSDLFEIDHLGLFGNDRFSDELPVYGTTLVNRTRIIN
ncbi:hypothetical protein LIER_32838 [Lithospermum erythrorhizon]|uniref:Protein BIG GRAIN 1-like E n=1 Tax=Lithospermum erythrorhizon TaxID=34254 RepID=A0AAV3RY39_LITER